MNCEKARCANCLVNEATHGSIFCQPCLDTMAFKRFLLNTRITFAFSFNTTEDGERSYVIKRYLHGKCFAIRYAAGWTLELICAGLAHSLPRSTEWLPFNETTGEFLP